MEVQAANIILGLSGVSDRFTIRWCGLRFRMKIRPISVRGVIQISRELAKLKDVDFDANMFPEAMAKAENLKHICRAIAIATGTRFPGIIARMLTNIDLKDLRTLWDAVEKQTDPKHFFFIMVSAKGLNQLKTTKTITQKPEPSGEVTQSSADLQ